MKQDIMKSIFTQNFTVKDEQACRRGGAKVFEVELCRDAI